MKKIKALSEYEELIKVKRFFIEGEKEFHDFTFEKIKKGLSEEYQENIDDKIERWIDITVYEHFIKAKPVEYYILTKMLYRDGFYEAAIVTTRSICEMICYDKLKNIKHPFGTKKEFELINFRMLLNFIVLPKEFEIEEFENSILKNISLADNKNFIKSSYQLNKKNKKYNLKLENAQTNKNLKRFLSILDETTYKAYEVLSKDNYNLLNQIYDLGNSYVHASQKLHSAKIDARNIIMNISKVLYDIYGIKTFDELKKLEIETAYKNYPDICKGINFMIEVYKTPNDAQKGYFNIPSETFIKRFLNLEGNWNGKWLCSGNLVDDVKLNIFKGNKFIKAIINHSFLYNNKQVLVTEELLVKLFQGYFHLLGYKHTFEPKIKGINYASNFFELEMLGDRILIGSHRCNTGKGKAIFYRNL